MSEFWNARYKLHGPTVQIVLGCCGACEADLVKQQILCAFGLRLGAHAGGAAASSSVLSYLLFPASLKICNVQGAYYPRCGGYESTALGNCFCYQDRLFECFALVMAMSG